MASKRDIVVTLQFDDKGTAKIQKTVQKTTETLKGAGAGAERAAGGFDKLRKSAGGAAENGFKKLATAAKSTMLQMAAGLGLWTSFSAVLGAVTRNMKDIVVQGREFDSSFAKVKVMLRDTGVNAAALKEQLLRMSPTLGSSASMAHMLAVSMREFSILPVDTHFNVISEAAMLATSAFTSNELAMEALVSMMKGFHVGTKDMSKVSSTLAKAMQLEDVEFEEITKTILKLSAGAYQAGIGLDELLAVFLTLKHTGQDAQTSMMQMRMLIQGIIKPSEAAKKAAKDLGLQWGASGVKALGFKKWLEQLSEATDGNLNTLDNLFQGGRTLVGVLNLTSTASEELTENIHKLKVAYGEGAENQSIFLERVKSINFWIRTAKDAFGKFKIAIWQGFTQEMMGGVKSGEELKKKIDEMTQKAIDFGFKAGQSIAEFVKNVSKIVQTIWSMKKPIEEIIKLYIAWWTYQKLVGSAGIFTALAKNAGNFGAALSLIFEGKGFFGKARNLGTLIGKGLGSPITGVTGALKALPAVAMAAFAGWQIGRLIGEVTGLDKALQKVFEPKAKDRTGGLTERHAQLASLQSEMKARAGELTKTTVTDLMKAKDILQKEFEKMGTLGSDALDTWAKGLGWVKKSILDTGGAAAYAGKILGNLSKESIEVQQEALDAASELSGQFITDLTQAEALLRAEFAKSGTLGTAALDAWVKKGSQTAMTLVQVKDKLKEYGYSLKTDLAERYDFLTLIMAKFNDQLTKADYKRIKDELRALGVALGKVSEAYTELGIITDQELKEKTSELAGWLSQVNKEFLAGTLPLWKYEKALTAIQERLDALSPYYKATLQGLQEIVNTPLPAPKNLPTEALAGPVATPEAQGLFKPEPYVNFFMKTSEAAEKLGVALKHDLVLNLENLQKAFVSLKESNQLTPETLRKSAETLIAAYKELGLKVPKELEGVAVSTTNVWEGVSATMVDYWTNAMAEMIKSGINFRDVVNTAWQTLATGAGKAIGNLATEALKGLGAAAGPIGSLIGTIGGTIISGIGKLFGIKSKAQKEAEAAKKAEAELKRQVEATTKAYKAFGDITESTAKKIIELTKQFNKQTATILTLTDVMNDAGISTKNLTLYLQKMVAALRDIASGRVDAQKGIEAIGEAFQQIVGWAQKFGGEGKKALVNFIGYLRQIGVSIAEVDEYVFGQLEKGAAGMQNIVESVGGASYKQLLDYKEQVKTLGEEVKDLSGQRLSDRAAQQDYLRKKAQLQDLQEQYAALKGQLADELKPELERVGRLTLTTFNAFIAQGKSWTETAALMGDSLTGLRDKYRELGLTGGAALEDLFKLMDVSEAQAGLLDGIEGTRQLIEALGNTYFLTSESLADLSGQTQSYFDKLIANGVESQQALALIAPSLADLEYYAKQYGLAIDDGTQALIDQAKEAGVYREKGKDMATTLKEGFEAIVGKLNELVDLFGGRGGLIDRMREGLTYGKQYAQLDYEGGYSPEREVTHAATGFKGIVTGPRFFEIEKGVTEAVHIGEPTEVFNGTLGNVADALGKAKESVTRSVTTMVQNLIAVAEQQAASVTSQFAFAGVGAPVPAEHMFYTEPAPRQPISITKETTQQGNEEKVVVIDKKITIEPVVIPMREFESFLIKFVQKASADERVLVRPRSVRGRG